MPQYLTPGLYFEKVDAYQEQIAKIRTDIAGFVGIAEKGPLNQPVRLESRKQFQAVFGGTIPQSYLAYAVQGFFENEGKVCFVVRIANLKKAEKARINIKDKAGIDTIKVTALNEGKWGEKIKVFLDESTMGSTITADPAQQPADGSYSIVQNSIGFEKGSLVKAFQNKNGTPVEKYHYAGSVDKTSRKIAWETALEHGPADFDLSKPIHLSTREFTLTFRWNNRIKEIFKDLSLHPDHGRYLTKVINGFSHLVTVEDLASPPPVPDNIPDQEKMEKGFLYLENGKDGISSITIDDIIGDPSSVEKRGLRCFEEVDEVGMISIPDIMIRPQEIAMYRTVKTRPCFPPGEEISPASSPGESSPRFSEDEIERAQQAMIHHCEQLKDRVTILDSPPGLDIAGVLEWREKFVSPYAALYFPWINVNDPLRLNGNIIRSIPPSGFIAGVFARTDLFKGVHKAPANEEIIGAKDTDLTIDDAQQEILNPENINCIRWFPGRGVLIWGARTMDKDPVWRYINIRRLLIMIEESIEEAMQWAVFEPNDVHLRNSIRVTASIFLEELWREGALTGETAGEAFFVKCDEENNPQSIIDAGQIITDIGVAPSIPGEFIVFRIGKIKSGFEIVKEEV
jgi:phage tail sheath protein FI